MFRSSVKLCYCQYPVINNGHILEHPLLITESSVFKIELESQENPQHYKLVGTELTITGHKHLDQTL